MRTKILAAVLTAAAVLAVPSIADARYYMSEQAAESATWDYAVDRYGVIDPGTACRPQGERKADPRYDYHSWVCAWYEEGCWGTVLIKGSRNSSRYWYRTLHGQRCE